MAKAKKSSAKRSKRKGKSPIAARYGIARTWKRAQLVTSDYKALPASSISQVLSLTGFKDLTSLCAEISKNQRGHIASSLQKRLIRLFDLDFYAAEADEPILIKVGRKSCKLPYPFLADKTLPFTLTYNIADISFEEDERAGTLAIGVYIYVKVAKCFRARKKEDEDFCTLMANGVTVEDATDDEKAIISSWLSRNGMKSSDVKRVLENSDSSFDDCFSTISSRINSMLCISGAQELLGDEGGDTVLNEEDGYEEFIVY